MDALYADLQKLEFQSNLSRTISDLETLINTLETTRAKIAANPSTQLPALASLQKTAQQQTKRILDDQKELYNAVNRYGKAVDKKFKNVPTDLDPTIVSGGSADVEGKEGKGVAQVLSEDTTLLDRAIAMHLIREGSFEVAETFLRECREAGETISLPEGLRQSIEGMYEIRNALLQDNFEPAISWARQEKTSIMLEKWGSRLEWELCRCWFLRLVEREGMASAIRYAKEEFGRFMDRYLHEIEQLMSSILYINSPNSYSPYSSANIATTNAQLADFFTKEYCSLLNLSASSPLLLASTAGTIALPTLLKMSSLMREKKTAWTTTQELPVEIPLPPTMQFHNIFVCPVSKDQTSEKNPPVVLPCGHVIALESLRRLPRMGPGQLIKCPYCPKECTESSCRKVIL